VILVRCRTVAKVDSIGYAGDSVLGGIVVERKQLLGHDEQLTWTVDVAAMRFPMDKDDKPAVCYLQ
jgi:hypothetical protein